MGHTSGRWLAPVFLLRFVRTYRALWSILLAFLVNLIAYAFAFQGAIPTQSPAPLLYLSFAFGAGLFATVPYLADRLLVPRLSGFVTTLVFPLTCTTIEYLNATFTPFGTWGFTAYTQYGNLPLMQLVSVTGIWGISFLIDWCAAVVNWAWERGFAWPRVRGGGLLYGSILALVLVFGSARLAFFPPQASTVRVVGITPSQAVLTAFDKQLQEQTWQALLSGTATQAERERAREAFAPVNADLFARSEQEARAGAKIILWPEGGADVLQEDEAALIARGSELARTTGIYLDMGMSVLLSHPVQSRFVLDEIALIDPGGNVVWRYEKAHLVPGEQIVPGDGKVPTVQTPYGRLSNVICFDADFPGTLRQAGQAGADLMLVPSNDWQEIDPMHTRAITFRAIENGYSLVRQTKHGLAIAVDYEGHVLATADYFTTDQQVLVASVPTHGVRTIYSVIGDLFAWLAIAGLAIVTGLAIVPRRQKRQAPADGGGEAVREQEPVHEML